MPVVLCVTVVLSVGIGVAAAYAAISTILFALAPSSRPRPTSRPRLILVTSQNHASGD